MRSLQELEPDFGNYAFHGTDVSMDEAAAQPTVDYFDSQRYALAYPKAQIGRYVADQGFNVPLIRDITHWQDAMDRGVAMIRSDSSDDYAGYRGLFNSKRLPAIRPSSEDEQVPKVIQLQQMALQGLREGGLSPIDYMHYYAGKYATWPEYLVNILQTANRFNCRPWLATPQASLWEYIPGDNVSIFGDPHVAGRYHFGYGQYDAQRGGPKMAEGFRLEPGERRPLRLSSYHDRDFEPEPVIEMYEAISALPLFDVEQRPVMELQIALDGSIHFLQYYKTGHRKNFQEPFELPFIPDEDVKISDVRGVTPPEGKSFRMYLAPKKFMPAMNGEAVFCGFSQPRHLETQLLSKMVGFVLHRAYISFKDNHFASAPLFMPPLAAGLSTHAVDTKPEVASRITQRLDRAVMQNCQDFTNVNYVDVRVVSNGSEMVISSDWQIQEVPYAELH